MKWKEKRKKEDGFLRPRRRNHPSLIEMSVVCLEYKRIVNRMDGATEQRLAPSNFWEKKKNCIFVFLCVLYVSEYGNE